MNQVTKRRASWDGNSSRFKDSRIWYRMHW